jgi:hypothetical protein
MYVFQTFSKFYKAIICNSGNDKVFLLIKWVKSLLSKIYLLKYHCRQRAPVGNVPSASGTSQLSMIDIQATTKSKYYDHIVLLYLEYEP